MTCACGLSTGECLTFGRIDTIGGGLAAGKKIQSYRARGIVDNGDGDVICAVTIKVAAYHSQIRGGIGLEKNTGRRFGEILCLIVNDL